VVIGDELCRLVNSIEGYNFSRITNNLVVNELGYTVYQISKKKKTLEILTDPKSLGIKTGTKGARNLG